MCAVCRTFALEDTLRFGETHRRLRGCCLIKILRISDTKRGLNRTIPGEIFLLRYLRGCDKLHRLHRIAALDILHGSRHVLKRLPDGSDGVDHRLVDRLEDAPLVLELHLALLRMDIDIDGALRHSDVQDDQWKTRFRQERVIGVVDRLGNRLVRYDAAIHDEGLPSAAALEHRRLRDVARDLDVLILEGKRQKCVGSL